MTAMGEEKEIELPEGSVEADPGVGTAADTPTNRLIGEGEESRVSLHGGRLRTNGYNRYRMNLPVPVALFLEKPKVP